MDKKKSTFQSTRCETYADFIMVKSSEQRNMDINQGVAMPLTLGAIVAILLISWILGLGNMAKGFKRFFIG